MNANDDCTGDRPPIARPETPGTCSQVQPLLFAYLSRELGAKQSEFIRNHLRHCPACSREAADILETVALLRADTSVVPPDRISKGVRSRLERALLHPFLEWCYVHRRLVSWVAALALISLALIIALACTRYQETATYWIGH